MTCLLPNAWWASPSRKLEPGTIGSPMPRGLQLAVLLPVLADFGCPTGDQRVTTEVGDEDDSGVDDDGSASKSTSATSVPPFGSAFSP